MISVTHLNVQKTEKLGTVVAESWRFI